MKKSEKKKKTLDDKLFDALILGVIVVFPITAITLLITFSSYLGSQS